ncbi:MAG: Epoxyqueuosine reductase [Pelotomaculum sp. PtaB.Bin104]|nr:MAG: Epoxyqueuosine reductase [Pelotomaculum sp. PtaB.Bin104]
MLAYKVLSSCESSSWTTALNGYLDLQGFARSTSYRAARFLENNYGAKVATIPIAYPFEMHNDRKAVADFSHRHAAVAAGLGTFGRHNLVIHPRFGTRVNFVSIISNLDMESTLQKHEDLCVRCDLCVENCPGRALDHEGITDVMKCMKNSLPYGLVEDIGFWIQFANSSPEEQKEMLMRERYANLKQSAHLGNQYMCFNCMKTCPVGC